MSIATSRPIRLRFEHTRYPHWGGHSGYIQFVRYLNVQRYESTVHAASLDDADLPNYLKLVKPLLRRLIARAGMPQYKLSGLIAETMAFVGCLRRSFDIIHFLDGDHSGQFVPRLVKTLKLRGTRTIATFHQPPEVARQILNEQLLQWFDKIVLVSPSQLSFFSQHVPADRLHVILHGIDTDFFRPNQKQNQTNRIRCITVGHWLRNWSVFADVARAMSDIDFDVIPGPQIELDGLSNVRVNKVMPDEVLAEAYRSADVLFLPLIQSTANNALLEGIASGLPVVTTDLEAVRAYLPNGEGIFVKENRVDNFVSALRNLQKNAWLRHIMGARARTRAEALAWPRIVPQYEALYSDAADRLPKDS